MNEPRNDPHDKESGNSDHSRHHSCNVSIHQPAHLLSETVRPESHLKNLFLFSSLLRAREKYCRPSRTGFCCNNLLKTHRV